MRLMAQIGWIMGLVALWGGVVATLRHGYFIGFLAMIDILQVSIRIAIRVGYVMAGL
jgi:hypothetical protein